MQSGPWPTAEATYLRARPSGQWINCRHAETPSRGHLLSLVGLWGMPHGEHGLFELMLTPVGLHAGFYGFISEVYPFIRGTIKVTYEVGWQLRHERGHGSHTWVPHSGWLHGAGCS